MDQWGENIDEEPAAPPPAPSVLEHEAVPGTVALVVALGTLLTALYPAWGDGWVPIRGDAMTYFWPLREALAEALRAGTLPLYEATNNGGTPLWLNPQTQAFYPPARLYGFVPVPHAIGILHSAHLVLLFGGVVALLRRLNFGYSSASLASLCVALGGTFLSVSAMQDKAHSAAWIPLMLWAGLSLHTPALLPRVVLAASTAMAVFAGGLDMVVLGILTTIVAACVAGIDDPEIVVAVEEEPPEEKEDDLFGDDVAPRDEDDFQPLLLGEAEDQAEGAAKQQTKPQIAIFSLLWADLPERGEQALKQCLKAGLWIALGLGLSAQQWLPFRALIENSSWGQTLDAAELGARSLRFGDVLGLVAPNLPYDAAEGVYRPLGQKQATGVYLPGLYAGGGAVLLWLLGMVQLGRAHCSQATERWLIPGPTATAALASLACVIMAVGPALPPIGWIETHVPILSSIRYPEKWLLPAAILAAAPIAEGARLLASNGWSKIWEVRSAVGVVGLTLLTALLGLFAADDLGRGMLLAAGSLSAGLSVCALWRLQARSSSALLGVLGIALAVLIAGMDLSVHNLPLAPLEDPGELVTPPIAVTRILRSADQQRRNSGTLLEARARVHQASYAQHRADPVTAAEAPLHQILREALLGGVATVWGIEIMRDWLVMSPSKLDEWYEAVLKMPLARQFDGLRLAGITHIVVHFRDDALELLPLVGKGLEEVYTPEGDWVQVVVFALTDPLPACRWTPLGMPAADGLPVVPEQDSGGIWRGRVSGGRGLLVCLRPWDPAWHVEVDGEPAHTQIVNGFQLAVPVPAGAHDVSMQYRPKGMHLARRLRTLSAALFFMVLGVSLLRNRRRDATDPSASSAEHDPSADATEGDATEGDATEGDETEGDAAEGDATEGDAAEGDAAEGDETEGDATEGDAAEGDATEGDAAEGDAAEGDAADSYPAAEDPDDGSYNS